MQKITAIAPSNIAFIKYWGRNNEDERLPANGSISMSLNNLFTTTTVAFDLSLKKDDVTINNKKVEKESERVTKQLDSVRNLSKRNIFAKVVSENSFPSSSGLSSSASGFAALTAAATRAIGFDLSEKDLSILARQGSGSACRSIPSGFVEWYKGESSETSYALSIFPSNHWEISDVVIVVSDKKKYIPTSASQQSACTSPFFEKRLSLLPKKIADIKKLIKEKKFTTFGELIEKEALEFHAILLTSNPSLIYWLPETLSAVHDVRELRSKGVEAYFTINTGHDVHVICQQKDTKKIADFFKKKEYVKDVIVNVPNRGVHYTNKHLF